LKALGETCEKTDWEVHAYCLMSNHFHLAGDTPKPNLVDGMKWLLGAYTRRFNRRHKKFGHLFSGRYKSLVVDGSGNGYLRTVCEYVHLNPVRAKRIGKEQALKSYRWSSFPSYLMPLRKRAAVTGQFPMLTITAMGAPYTFRNKTVKPAWPKTRSSLRPCRIVKICWINWDADG